MRTLTEDERKLLSDYVKRSFRNQADRDYIAARVSYRLALYPQFLWSSLQAIEKYLKAILLWSCQSIKDYRHNALALMKAVADLPSIGFAIPARAANFVEFVTNYGVNRYLDSAVFLNGGELWELDWTVWHVRRFCRDFLLMPGDADRYEPIHSTTRLRESQEAHNQRAVLFRLDGFLEEVLTQGPAATRAALVYKNPCFSRSKRLKIKNVPWTIMFENPTHVMRPQILPLVEELVQFPKEVRALLRDHAAQGKREA